ncbi:FAD-dependent oxidoreductase [Roseomonas eburnea]|uniref:FAD-dependent oxidoreductase n=1 Tax=Neoroseomonas eburnea TaxID=1346889 RepID=A0A9X9X9L4_9PROT|nr:(2Fe-2S)-binding protein [Neoroseomonas eburnea]MBR0680400.1 FAD-dependent oxidoreductase [Neoroseomonas eburnea]
MTNPDPTSIAGKTFPLRGSFGQVVVGAGAAGIAAARAAAAAGMATLLVDEHPLDPGLFGLDIPYLFGARLDAATRNAARMEERIVAARPDLLAAMEEGVEVALGVAAWGGFVKGVTSRAMARPLLGLADREAAWLVGFDRLTIATGARDVVLPFPGWTLPGVVGARGFDAALRLYGAFSGQRLAVLGGGALADGVVAAARAAGLDVALHRTTPARLRILGREEVAGIAWQDGAAWRETVCDTVVMAVDTVPMVDLPDVLGCAIAWDAARGGFAPALGEDGRASLPGVTILGDATGTAPMARAAWLDLALEEAETLVCACEEVGAGDLRALRPPRYLDAPGPQAGLAALGPLNQDQVKRLTRAGMGPCQGRRCREAVHALLSHDGPAPLASHRAPVRPLPLSVLAALEEDPALRANWTGWFGIAAQWLPHWEPAPADAEYIGGRLSPEDVVK